MGLLLDIDGTVTEAGRPIPGAVEALERLRARGVPLLFATNTSRMSRAEVAASLRKAGVEARVEEILSAGYAAAVHLRGQRVRRVQLLLPAEATTDWTDFERTEDAPEAVVVGDLGPTFSFELLNSAFRNLHAGATLVATQKNRFWKAESGWTLDAGPFVAALEYAARTEALVIGKPAPGFFRMAAELLGEPAGSLTIVGDDVEVDVAGGKRGGLSAVLVRTGKYDETRLRSIPADLRPDAIIDSIADLPDALAAGPASG